MAAKMKGLDKPSGSTSAVRRHKDINTFVNNQLKFSTGPSPSAIPPDQMKCNILKAVSEERAKRGTACLQSAPLLHCSLCNVLHMQVLL